MNFKFQLGDHMARAGFPSGNLTPAHMLSFKNLNVRLGLLCLTAFGVFIDLKKSFPSDQRHHLRSSVLKICLLSTTIHHAQLFLFPPLRVDFIVHEFTDGDGPLLFSFLLLSPPPLLPHVLLCPSLPSYSRLRSSLICTFWKPVVCLSTTCTLFNPLRSLLTTNMLRLHRNDMLNYW